MLVLGEGILGVIDLLATGDGLLLPFLLFLYLVCCFWIYYDQVIYRLYLPTAWHVYWWGMWNLGIVSSLLLIRSAFLGFAQNNPDAILLFFSATPDVHLDDWRYWIDRAKGQYFRTHDETIPATPSPADNLAHRCFFRLLPFRIASHDASILTTNPPSRDVLLDDTFTSVVRNVISQMIHIIWLFVCINLFIDTLVFINLFFVTSGRILIT